MFREAERRFLFAVFAIVCLALTGAVLFFTVKYAKDNLYDKEPEGYYTVAYTGYEDLDETLAPGGELALPAIERTGYTFLGWYLDEDYTVKVESGAVATGNMTLYPLLRVRQYMVTAHNYNGTETITLDYGRSFYIDYGVRTGHEFAGWYFDAEGNTPVSYDVMPAENLEIYARWRVKKYTVKYHVEDEPQISDASVEYGAAVELPVREKVGHTFVGWYTNSGLTTPFPAGGTMPAETLHLYPKFAVNTYTVTFMDSDMETELLPALGAEYGGDLSYLYADGEYDASILPTKVGNIFLYWHLEGEDEPYEFTTMPVDGLVLYAAWLHI